LFSFVTNTNAQEVIIGSQIWTNENLAVSTFRNGEVIQEAKTKEEWQKAGENKQPAWCYYNYDVTNMKFGKLYNWYAVNDTRGLAQAGWHIPSDEEWTKLTDFLGGESVAGKKLKNGSEWKGGGNGTNESGFNALPGGICLKDGSFGRGSAGYMGYMGYWWSSTEGIAGLAWRREITSKDAVDRYYNGKDEGLSVRCIKD
jgi:uncharacterized protein (TIGR02145 family)